MDIFAIPKIKARTTGRIGKGQPGRFWQRPGLVGSGKENEVGRPLADLACLTDLKRLNQNILFHFNK